MAAPTTSLIKPPRPAEPLDETVWRDPGQYDGLGRRLTFNTVMQYFHASSFFDHSSNNGQLINIIQSRPDVAMNIQSQQAFNDYLKNMIGVEYIPVMGNEKSSEGPPVWVIRQQKRFGKKEDEVVRMNTFFVVGENVFMAPSVGEVMANKLMAITYRLRASLDLASTALAAQATVPSSSTSSNLTSTSTSMTTISSSAPQPPSSQSISTPASLSNSALAPSQPTPATQVTQSRARQDQIMLQTAFQWSMNFQDDCLDDHGPLLLDPGALISGGSVGGLSSQGGGVGGSQGSGGRPGTGTAGTGTPVGGVAVGQQGVRGVDVRKRLLK